MNSDGARQTNDTRELNNVACKDCICMLSLLQDFEFIFFMKPILNDVKTFPVG